jgi:signal transduction histidine kinase
MEEQLTEIFDPFFTTKENGTGIGLSVAQQIIRQHGGTLTAERNKDRGMTFSILLPLQQQEEQTERRMMHEASASVG